jgi:hypothetical protein
MAHTLKWPTTRVNKGDVRYMLRTSAVVETDTPAERTRKGYLSLVKTNVERVDPFLRLMTSLRK